jgi:hypothetical protein
MVAKRWKNRVSRVAYDVTRTSLVLSEDGVYIRQVLHPLEECIPGIRLTISEKGSRLGRSVGLRPGFWSC